MLFVRITPGVGPFERRDLERAALAVIPKALKPTVTGGGTMLMKPFTSDFEIATRDDEDLIDPILDAVKSAVLAKVAPGTDVEVHQPKPKPLTISVVVYPPHPGDAKRRDAIVALLDKAVARRERQLQRK